MEEDSKETGLSNVIRIDDERVREHLGHIVRGTVEETLNAMMEAEADRLCNAGRYERTAARRDQRSGSYDRKLQTKAGAVTLKVPKLRQQTFETAIIERYRRRERSVEEALIEMYLAGVSVRRVEDITEALWGTRVSPGTVSNLNKKIYGQIEAWRNQPIEGEQPYLYSTASCSSALGRARYATSHCWWRSRSTPRDTGRFSASSRAPRRTRPVGAPS
jgi:putative transposase